MQTEYEIAHVICLKCYKRWLATYPDGTLLVDLECPQCHEQGYVIKTGQSLSDTIACYDCKLFVDDKCKLGLCSTQYCGFKLTRKEQT